MSKNIWKVIKIIDDYQIVINGGKNDSLKAGDKLEIYGPGEPLIDPDTKENLGNLDILKATIVVHHVYDKFSVCINAETSFSNIAKAATNLGTLTMKGISDRLPLKVDSKQITGYSSDADKTIRLGDSVGKILY